MLSKLRRLDWSTMDRMAPNPRSIQPDYDVVVVGARAAGASTAMLIARRGLSVLAVDRSAYGSDTLSTHSLAGGGVLQLSRWGLLDPIRAAGTPVTSRVEFDYLGDRVSIDVPARGDVDGLYSPRRTLLDATIVDAAVAAGADVVHGVSMVGVLTDPTGRVDGVELDVDGRHQQVRARFVVGADGMRSRVARHVGAAVVREETMGATSSFAYFEGLRSDTIVTWFGLDRVVGVIPTNDGLACVWIGQSVDRFQRLAKGRVAQAHRTEIESVPELADQLGGRQPIGGHKSFLGSPGFLRQAWGPGWALVGDAGYFKDPISAHGITDALIGAELLSDAICDVLVGGDAEAHAFWRFEKCSRRHGG